MNTMQKKWAVAWCAIALFGGIHEARAAVIAANDGTNFDWLVIDSTTVFDDASGSLSKVNYSSWVNESNAWNSDSWHDGNLGLLGSDSATYTFKGLVSGIYTAAVSYSDGGNRPTDAPYSIDGGTPILINQGVAANDVQLFHNSNAGINEFFEILSTMVLVTDGDLQVILGDSTTGFTVADAVAIRRVGDLPVADQLPEPASIAVWSLMGLFGLAYVIRRRCRA